MKDYDVYLFDFDGTLCDTIDSLYPTFRYGFDAVGMHDITDAEIEEFTHHNLTEVMDEKNVKEEDRPLFIAKIVEALDNPEFIEMIKPFPETFEVLKELKSRGKRLGIVSNNTTHHIELTLKLLNFPDVFETIVGSERVAHAKPAPDCIYKAQEDMKIDHRFSTVYVGDSLQDGETGHKANVGSIVVDRHNRYEKVTGEKIFNLGDLLV